jgi:hypothetical protein
MFSCYSRVIYTCSAPDLSSTSTISPSSLHMKVKTRILSAAKSTRKEADIKRRHFGEYVEISHFSGGRKWKVFCGIILLHYHRAGGRYNYSPASPLIFACIVTCRRLCFRVRIACKVNPPPLSLYTTVHIEVGSKKCTPREGTLTCRLHRKI